MPSQSAYNAAKFAVRGFTEALRQEMLIAGHPVEVTCVHPGGIKTAIARNAGTVEGLDQSELAEFFDRKLAKTSAESAAKTILRGVVGNRPRVLVGLDAKALDVLVRLIGPRYQRLFATRRATGAAAQAAHPEPGDRGRRRAAREGLCLMHLPRLAVVALTGPTYRLSLHHRLSVRMQRWLSEAGTALLRPPPERRSSTSSSAAARPSGSASARRTGRARCCTCTAVAMSSGRRGCTAHWPDTSPVSAARWCSPSTTGSPPSTRTRPRSTTPWPRSASSLTEHGFDPARIAVAGDSAGGGLAVAAARRLTDAGCGPARSRCSRRGPIRATMTCRCATSS